MTHRPKVVLYSRVSSVDQLGNNSLPTQKQSMVAHARREGFEVLELFEERGVSAKSLERPELQALMRFIEARSGEVSAVLCYDYSRLSRETADHFVLRAFFVRHKVRVISITQPVTEDPFGEFVETLYAALSKLDNDQRGARSKRGMEMAVERGRWVWRAPIGYLNCGRNASPSLCPDPDRAALVTEAFERVAGGEVPVTVYADLIGRGFTTRHGKPIGRTTFYTALRKPVYAGELQTTLGAGRGDWQPLVKASTWQRVQTVVSKRDRGALSAGTRRAGRRPYRRFRPGFELRGFLTCAECGGKFTGGVTKGHAYLHCVKGHVRSRADVLNGRFRAWLVSVRPNEIWMHRLERHMREEWEEQQATLRRQRLASARATSAIETKLERLNEDRLDRVVDRETYRQLYVSLKGQESSPFLVGTLRGF